MLFTAQLTKETIKICKIEQEKYQEVEKKIIELIHMQ
jgi:hypothetical protein